MTTKTPDLAGIKYHLVGKHMEVITNQYGSLFTDENIEAALNKVEAFNGYKLIMEKNAETGTTSLNIKKVD
jgi:hypothetical protein